MCKLKLIEACKLYKEQIMMFKKEMLENKDSFAGCVGLEEVETFEEWLNFNKRLEKKYGKNFTPSTVYLAVRSLDNIVVGILDLRYPLSEYLFNFGGNIGYSVRPSERGKGYASEMLRLILPICFKLGVNPVLLVCDKDNKASQKVILKNGGILENEVIENNNIIQRYWI